jgi:hypothetical protein
VRCLKAPWRGRRLVRVQTVRVDRIHRLDQRVVKHFLPDAIGQIDREQRIGDQLAGKLLAPILARGLPSVAVFGIDGSERSYGDPVGAIAEVGDDRVIAGRDLANGPTAIHRVIDVVVLREPRARKKRGHALGVDAHGAFAPQAEIIEMAASVVAQQAVVMAHAEELRRGVVEHPVVCILRRSGGAATGERKVGRAILAQERISRGAERFIRHLLERFAVVDRILDPVEIGIARGGLARDVRLRLGVL